MYKIKNKKKMVNKKGFSLVETMVAIFIFSILMTILSGAFVGFISNFAQQKKEQKMVENAQYALGLMEKTIRTSVVQTAGAGGVIDFGADGKMLKMYDNSQSKCVAYQYKDSLTDKQIVMITKDAGDISECGTYTGVGYTTNELTPKGIIENVSVMGTVSSGGVPGLVSVAFTVKETGQSNSYVVGMSASLRDKGN